MSHTLPSGSEQRWQEVLRRAAVTLKGRGVGVWEADALGQLHLLAASSPQDLAPVATEELEAAVRKLGESQALRPAPHRWLASRLRRGRWCIAPVRSEPPEPPPTGVERRGPERLTLELAAVCIGLIDAPDRHATASPDP